MVRFSRLDGRLARYDFPNDVASINCDVKASKKHIDLACLRFFAPAGDELRK